MVSAFVSNSKHQKIHKMIQEQTTKFDHSKKRILARGCDPQLSREFARIAPSLLSNAEYVPTTDDVEFVEKLKSQKWSVVYFAPGACRYSAAQIQIPGGNQDTKNWTLEEYHELIYALQGSDIQIVETPYEQEAIDFLRKGLASARDVK